MGFEPEVVETITVDSYGTLVDPNAVEEALVAEVDVDPQPISRSWRSRSLMYTMVGNFIGDYQPFYEMNRDALRFALERHGVDIDEETQEEILSTYHELDVFDDVRDGIERLQSGGYEVYVVSNGNPEMLDSMVAHADIDDLIADTISAHEIETFKPDPGIYRHAATRTDTPIENIVHVAGPVFDVQGARSTGMQAIWLDRGDKPYGEFGPRPHLEIETFFELADALGV
ncbi:MAG: haloacid dehalogenase type II [Haloplanus sp.]